METRFALKQPVSSILHICDAEHDTLSSILLIRNLSWQKSKEISLPNICC